MTQEKKDPLDNIIPDPDKVLKNLEINASYVSSMQQIVLFIITTATEADQITNAYKKIELLEKSVQDGDEYKGEPLTAFDHSLMTAIHITAYLRAETIKQKAYVKFEGKIDKEAFGDNIKDLLEASPDEIDDKMAVLAQKMADSLGEAQPANEG